MLELAPLKNIVYEMVWDEMKILSVVLDDTHVHYHLILQSLINQHAGEKILITSCH